MAFFVEAVYVSSCANKWPATFLTLPDGNLVVYEWDPSHVAEGMFSPISAEQTTMQVFKLRIAPIRDGEDSEEEIEYDGVDGQILGCPEVTRSIGLSVVLATAEANGVELNIGDMEP